MNRWTTTAYRSAKQPRFCFINVFDRHGPSRARVMTLPHRRARHRAAAMVVVAGFQSEDLMYRRIGDAIYEQTGRGKDKKFVAKLMKGTWYRLATNKLGQPEWECCDPNQCAMFDELIPEDPH